MHARDILAVSFLHSFSLIDKMFYSKKSQTPVDAISLTPGRPTKEKKRALEDRRVKGRFLFVHTSFTFVNPSLF